MGYLMRRLRRICSAVGNNKIRFISCSATTANPVQHFMTLFGLPEEKVQLVHVDGSPSGRKEFICWNTPFRDPGDPASGRGDATKECARLFCQLMLRGVRTIAFTKTRSQCERIVAGVKAELKELGRAQCAGLVMGYRGGYTLQDRRSIEKQMFEGKLLGIVATTALELGVDIGSLDAVITWGFPFSIANLRQQSGRAGRRNRDSLSILVGGSFSTDQYFMQNPDEIFNRPNEEAALEMGNVLMVEGHLQCAAHEMPLFPPIDEKFFGRDTNLDLAQLCRDRLVADENGYYHTHPRFLPYPSKFVNIRSTDRDDHIPIIDVTNNRNVVLETLEKERATFTLYDGAIFLHQGQKYLVRDFDPNKSLAKVEKVNVDWTTLQREYTDVDAIETEESRRLDLAKEKGHAASLLLGKKRKDNDTSEATDDDASLNTGRTAVKSKDNSTTATTTTATPTSSASTPSSSNRSLSHKLPARAYKGKIRITQQVFGFFKISSSNRILDAISVSNSPVIRHSKGTWLDLPAHVLGELASHDINVAAAIHSASHAVMSLFPLYVSGLGPGDVMTECKVPTKELARRETRRKRPARLTFYDVRGSGAGGAGLSVKAFEFLDFLLPKALGRVEGCGCREGCIECVYGERCNQGNEVSSKVGAVVVLRGLLGWQVDWGLLGAMVARGDMELGTPAGVETVVLAEEVPFCKTGRS